MIESSGIHASGSFFAVLTKPIVKKGNKYLSLKSSFYKVEMSRYKLRSFDLIKATIQTGTSCKVIRIKNGLNDQVDLILYNIMHKAR